MNKPAVYIAIMCLVVILALALALLVSPKKGREASASGAFIDPGLRALIRSEIYSRRASAENTLVCCDFDVIGTRSEGKKLTVYLRAVLSEYCIAGPEAGLEFKRSAFASFLAAASAEAARDSASGYKLSEFIMADDAAALSKSVKNIPANVLDALGASPSEDGGRASGQRLEALFDSIAADETMRLREVFSEQPEFIYSASSGERSFYSFRTPSIINRSGFVLDAGQKTYQMNFGPLSSYIGLGSYSFKNGGNTLELNAPGDGLDRIRFEKLGPAWVAERSGAVYFPSNWAATEFSCLDSKGSDWALGCLAVRGKFVLTIRFGASASPTAYEMFEMPESNYSFIEQDGNYAVSAMDADGELHIYNISIDGHRLRLFEGGKELEPFEIKSFTQFC